jgi:hypothetical protein
MPGIYAKYFPTGGEPRQFRTRGFLNLFQEKYTDECVADLNTYRNCPGLTIMREVSKRNLTFATLVDRMQVYFHNGNFTWVPTKSEGGANWAKILDGDQNDGECNCLAYALLKLSELPQPFGLGVVGAAHQAYRGALHGTGSGKGFISQHPAGGILGLLPNVTVGAGVNLVALGVTVGNGVYLWLNHKVVQNGHFYDPCYRQIWNPIEQMALGRLVGHTRRTAGVIPASFQETDTFYDVADIGGVNYYFRQLSNGERVAGLAYEMLGAAPAGPAVGDSTM